VSVAWRGQLGLDYGQGQDVSLLHDVQTGSEAHTASYSESTGGSFTGDENLSKLLLFLMPYLISRVPSFLIESRATPGILASYE
jgi:hypothetical protein